MSESKAVESYNAFDSIRNRFGGARKASSDAPTDIGHQQKKVSSKRRYDPWSKAPPLIPLVEESDIVQVEQFVNSEQSSPVKGRWKHSNTTKAYGPDFDALETASFTSGSSAYSSRSGSSMAGSMSELSDISSTDTHFEYDITSSRTNKEQHTQIASLRASFEKNKSFDQSDVRYTNDDGSEVSDEVVPGRTKAWNKYIGEWIFSRIEKVVPASPVDHTRRISNEVRVPTPTSTPVYGSMENLYGTGSRTSLLSSNPDEDSEEEQIWNWTQERKPPLGKFLNQQHLHRRRSHSASSLTSRTRKVSCEGSFSETDLTVWEEPGLLTTEKPLSPLVHSSTDTKPGLDVPDQQEKKTGDGFSQNSKEATSSLENGQSSTTKNQEKPAKQVSVLVRRVSEPVLKVSTPVKPVSVHIRRISESVEPVSEDKDEFKKLQKITPAKSNKWLEAYKKYRNDKEKLGDTHQETSEADLDVKDTSSIIEEESEGQEEQEELKIGQRIASKSKKWRDAYQKYRTIKETHSDQPATTQESQAQTTEQVAPAVIPASLEQRAKVFGGMQRRPLKRSQSFQFGSHSNQRNRKPLVERRPSIVG